MFLYILYMFCVLGDLIFVHYVLDILYNKYQNSLYNFVHYFRYRLSQKLEKLTSMCYNERKNDKNKEKLKMKRADQKERIVVRIEKNIMGMNRTYNIMMLDTNPIGCENYKRAQIEYRDHMSMALELNDIAQEIGLINMDEWTTNLNKIYN